MRRIVIALVIIALLGLGFYWLSRPKPIPVVLKEVTEGKVEATLANTRAGTIEACQRTKLSTIIGGRIEYLGVKEGDKVKKGQLLLKLWNDDQQAQAALSQTQIVLAGKRSEEVCIAAVNAEKEAKRQAELRARGFVSSSREEVARTDAEVRRAACNTAKADVAQAEAKFKATKIEQGRVLNLALDPSTQAEGLRAICDFTLDALPGKILPGKVRRVAPYVSAVEKQARTVDIEVDFEQPESAGKLLVGYSADVEIILAGRDKVLRIPTAAIQEGGRVLLFNADSSKLEARQIKTGLSNWEYTEVLEGLKAGDRIVTSLEKEGVKAGAVVTPDEKAKAR